MKMQKSLFSLLSVLLLSGLTACSQVKSELGLDRHSPDEFTVVKRAPLSMPPNYSLRAPDEGAEHPTGVATKKAQEQVFGRNTQKTTTTAKVTTGEATLLRKMGATKADRDIRQKLNRENGYLDTGDKSLSEKILFWQDRHEDSMVVDPVEEKARIEENKAAGQPINHGDVKTKGDQK